MTRSASLFSVVVVACLTTGCAMCDNSLDYLYPASGGCCGWQADDCARAGSAFGGVGRNTFYAGSPTPVEVESAAEPTPVEPESAANDEVPAAPFIEPTQVPATDLSPVQTEEGDNDQLPPPPTFDEPTPTFQEPAPVDPVLSPPAFDAP